MVVLCVYLKENLKIRSLFGREQRLDKEYENEVLRRQMGNHMAFEDELEMSGTKTE